MFFTMGLAMRFLFPREEGCGQPWLPSWWAVRPDLLEVFLGCCGSSGGELAGSG